MKQTSETIIKCFETVTEGTKYRLECTFINNELTRMTADAYRVNQNSEHPTEEYIGNLYYDNKKVGCSMSYVKGMYQYFSDFEALITEVSGKMP